MASNGIKDRVAIVGMGCTRFGERWDKGADELLVDAVEQCFAATPALPKADVDAYWLGTMNSGQSGTVLSKPLGIDYKPVTRVENMCATGSEAFRNACYAVASGAYDRVMAVGVEKLEGHRLLRPRALQRRRRRHRAGGDADRAGRLLAARPRLLPQVRRRPAGDA